MWCSMAIRGVDSACRNVVAAKESKVQVFETQQVVNFFKVESDAALLPS